MKIAKDFCLFCGYSVDEAKAYISRFGYTQEEVRILGNDNHFLVLTKKTIDLKQDCVTIV